MMKKKSFKWMFALVGAALLSGSVLTACSDDEKKEVTGEEGKGENGGGGNSEPELNFDGSPYITKVLDYRPAPGQFVNTMPAYKEGDTQETMNQKVLVATGNGKKGVITLGAYGGYVIVGFDHTIQNVKGEKDFRVLGNAFSGSSEPAIVMVAYDKNQNGEPDADEWYELAGSEYKKEATVKGYEITYFRNEEGHEPTPDTDNYLADVTNCPWTDNQNGTGYVHKNTFNKQEYFPQWIDENQMVFKGTLLPKNGVDNGPDAGIRWVLNAYEWGCADNTQGGDVFDISWAVNEAGKSVELPGVDFIKVYTGVNQYCGWLGETSTEFCGVEDLHVLTNQ